MHILYICNGNVARSQEAELFTNTFAAGKHTATSAGVNPKIGKPIDPVVVEVMGEIGYDMDACVRKPITRAMVDSADLIISFKPLGELPEFVRTHGTVQYWNIADPQGQDTAFHRKTRDAVRAKVESLLSTI